MGIGSSVDGRWRMKRWYLRSAGGGSTTGKGMREVFFKQFECTVINR